MCNDGTACSVTLDYGCPGKNQIQGVQEKLSSATSPIYIAARDCQRSQRNASVQPLLLAPIWQISVQTIAAQALARDRWQNYENSWKKKS